MVDSTVKLPKLVANWEEEAIQIVKLEQEYKQLVKQLFALENEIELRKTRLNNELTTKFNQRKFRVEYDGETYLYTVE